MPINSALVLIFSVFILGVKAQDTAVKSNLFDNLSFGFGLGVTQFYGDIMETENVKPAFSVQLSKPVTNENYRIQAEFIMGRMAGQNGAKCLEANMGGIGKLLSGVPGVEPATVTILGGGVVGKNAAIIATGMKATVSIVDKSSQRLKELHSKFGDTIIPLQSDEIDLNELIKNCDLLIGGVLVPGANAPKLVSKEMIYSMKRGAVIVDVAIDQGGCV